MAQMLPQYHSTFTKKVARHFVLFGIFSICISCASVPQTPYGTYSFEIGAPGEYETWDAHLAPDPAIIYTTLRQREGSNTTIYLLNKSGNIERPLVKIHFSDIDCDYGHEVILGFYKTPKEFHGRYFETIVPWDTTVEMVLEWGSAGEFAVTLNDETIRGQVHDRISIARIASANQVLKIEELVYEKSDQELFELEDND